MKKMIGRYTVAYTNGHKDVYEIAKDGKIERLTTGRSSKLTLSDNQIQFPSSNGWFKSSKLNRLVRYLMSKYHFKICSRMSIKNTIYIKSNLNFA